MVGTSRLKIVQMAILGDGYVGKTAMLRRFKGLSFDHNYKITVGADFVVKEIEVNGDRITLQIWDVGGQKQFSHLRSKYYRRVSGIVIVFDLMQRQTFEHIPIWLNEILEKNSWKLLPIVLVGNKNDLTLGEQSEVSTEDILEYRQILEDWGREFDPNFLITYIETSAKSGKNIDKVFMTLLSFIEKRRSHI